MQGQLVGSIDLAADAVGSSPTLSIMIQEQQKKINDVPMREASTKNEKLLLGFLHQESQRVDWGKIVVELTIAQGEIVNIKSSEISRTFQVGRAV